LLGGRALRHNRKLITGEIPPGISGYTTTLSRLFRGSQRLSAFNQPIPASFSAQLVTHRCGLNYCPPSRLFPGRRPPSRALPRRAPAASHARSHLAARPRRTARPRACGHRDGGQYLTPSGYEATDRRPGIYVRHASAARHSRLFYELARISVWESTGRFNFPVSCTSAAERGFRCRQAGVLASRLADGAV